jgi:hypothetical protein
MRISKQLLESILKRNNYITIGAGGSRFNFNGVLGAGGGQGIVIIYIK